MFLSFFIILKMVIIMADALEIIPRSLFSLVILFFVTKCLGKKQVSQLSLFDYVIGISIGNFAAEMTINMDAPYVHGIIAVVVFGVVAYFVSYVTMKSIKLRRFFIGVPTILVQNGKLIEKNFKKTKYDVNDFLEECRTGGFFDLNEIEYAIVEANGTLSILPKAEYKPLTPKDMNLKVSKSSLCANVIIDGKIMIQNLENMHKEVTWLEKELKVRGYRNPEPILLATLDESEKLIIYERNKTVNSCNVLE